ncbi:hypothetical protein BG004_005106 [Podila humilis]|nr:hypothetical protein BG004_005106 [Podila humilis]
MTKSMIRKLTLLFAITALTLLVLLQTASTTVNAAPIPQDGDDDGDDYALTLPLVKGIAHPFTTGISRGDAGAVAGTHETADSLGDAHAVANAGSESRRAVDDDHINGLAGSAVEAIAGYAP